MISLIIALLITLTAVCLIYYSWRNRAHATISLAGWTLAVISIFSWSAALGPEYGFTYAVIIFICLIWVTVVCNMQTFRSVRPNEKRPYRKLGLPAWQNSFSHGVLFLLSVPVAGILTMMLSAALVLYIPWSMATRLAVAIFLYPLLWGALGFWVCTQDKLVKPLVVCGCMFVFISALLFI